MPLLTTGVDSTNVHSATANMDSALAAPCMDAAVVSAVGERVQGGTGTSTPQAAVQLCAWMMWYAWLLVCVINIWHMPVWHYSFVCGTAEDTVQKKRSNAAVLMTTGSNLKAPRVDAAVVSAAGECQ